MPLEKPESPCLRCPLTSTPAVCCAQIATIPRRVANRSDLPHAVLRRRDPAIVGWHELRHTAGNPRGNAEAARCHALEQ